MFNDTYYADVFFFFTRKCFELLGLTSLREDNSKEEHY